MSFIVVAVNEVTPPNVDAASSVTLKAVIGSASSRLCENLSVLLVVNVNERAALNCICDSHGILSFLRWYLGAAFFLSPMGETDDLMDHITLELGGKYIIL